MQDLGHEIFVQSQDRIVDGHRSLEARFNAHFKKNKDDDETVAKESCKKWFGCKKLWTGNDLSK